MIWPHAAPCAVAVTIDIDGDLPFLVLDPDYRERLKSRSVGQYGTDHGAHRLLNVLQRVGVEASWFVPGAIADKHPQLIAEIAAAGHDIASHGDRHLDFDTLDLSGQIREILVGREKLQQLLGQPVKGFRTPAGEWRSGFLEEMASSGLQWSSSLPCDEQPFWLAETGILEVPFRYELEDLQYMGFNLDPPFPPGQSRITSHHALRENWRTEYEAAIRWGGMFLLRLNAEIMGTPGRARLLENFLLEIQRSRSAWITTCGGLHSYFKAELPEAELDHPFNLFTELSPTMVTETGVK